MLEEKEENQSHKRVNLAYLLAYIGTLLLGSVHFGYHLGIFNACMKYFMKMYNWENDQNAIDTWSSILTTLMPLGAMVTALISGPIMANGRRFALYLAASLTIAAALFMSVVHNPNMHHKGAGLAYFCFGRLLMGLAVGLYATVTPSYINEISPKHLTGSLGCCHQLVVTLGIVGTSVLGLLLPEGSPSELRESIAWRIAFGMPVIFVAIQCSLLFFVFTDDSPSFYASMGQWGRVGKTLKKIYADDEAVSDKVKEMKSAQASSTQSSSVAGSLYSNYEKAFWIGLTLPALQQLTGINIVIFYASKMFDHLGDFAKYMMLLTMFVNFLSTFGSVFMSDRLGRRFLLIWGSVGCAVGLLICMLTSSENGETSTVQDWIFGIGVFFFVSVFEMSHGPVCWVYMSEILPPSWMGYGMASSWIFTVLVAFSFPYLLSWLGRWTYFVYLVFMIFSTIFCYIYVKETKGKTKQEIMDEFSAVQPEAQVAIMSQT